MTQRPRVGVLALQGDFAEHLAAFRQLGLESQHLRHADELDAIDALVIPGGESTTILKLLDRFELRDRLSRRIEEGMAVFGTCAGAIVLAADSSDGEKPMGLLDIGVDRNAYGPQTESFQCRLEVEGVGEIDADFIRAPVIVRVGAEVAVLASLEGAPVLVRQDNILASTFHTEVAGDLALHRYFLEEVCDVRS